MPANVTQYKKIYSKKRLEEYLEQCQDDVEQVVVQENTEKGYIMYKDQLRVSLPSIEGYAAFLKKGRQTLYDWAKAFPEFKSALDKIKQIQKQVLIEKGLEGTYNPTITKLMLSANHGMRESSDITSGGGPINSFSDDQINKIADRITRGRKADGDSPSA